MEGGKEIKVVECPRDAMQGWKTPIDTAHKIDYLNQLLKVGFDTLDFGSFVSPRKVPQMADTALIAGSLPASATKLLAIVANARGAAAAVGYNNIYYLGFPFSISPTFQERNINSTVEDSFNRIQEIQAICAKGGNELVVYISMAFGNPYQDKYDHEMVLEWVGKIVRTGVKTISLSDTVGIATPEAVANLYRAVKDKFPDVETGVHLHSRRDNWQEKVDAALDSGCRRFDGALHGIGGCPMAEDTLVGNMDTLLMVPYFIKKGYCLNLNSEELEKAAALARRTFI